MPKSYFDQLLYSFICKDPKCGQQFAQTLRSLIKANEVVCPKCGTAIDIRESRRTGDIGLTLNDAAELDKQRDQKK
jgi:DNA-directed RNA polymerase subunit RPC12/RpoP